MDLPDRRHEIGEDAAEPRTEACRQRQHEHGRIHREPRRPDDAEAQEFCNHAHAGDAQTRSEGGVRGKCGHAPRLEYSRLMHSRVRCTNHAPVT